MLFRKKKEFRARISDLDLINKENLFSCVRYCSGGLNSENNKGEKKKNLFKVMVIPMKIWAFETIPKGLWKKLEKLEIRELKNVGHEVDGDTNGNFRQIFRSHKEV